MPHQIAESEKKRMQDELFEFLSIPSISTLPAHAADCRKAAEWVADHLRKLGCPTVKLLEGDGHPVVWGESPEVPGAPTVLIYGHYDVQPVDPVEEWKTPPFEPTVVNGKVFARGSADDKGQVYCLFKAYQSVLDANGKPPINVKFMIEGEEECGGHVITDLIAADPSLIDADAILICDMSYYDKGWPAVYSALRGLCYAEIHLRTAKRDLHSGTYGGVAPNAIETIVRLLADLKSRQGRIKIPEIYEAVKPPTKAEKSAWKKLPFNEKRFRVEEVTAKELTGIASASVFERTWALPTFEIHGIRGGFVGDGAKTVIPATAVAKVSLRLVPGLTVAKTIKWLTREVKKLAPKYAEVEVKPLHGGDPVQVDTEARPFKVLDAAFKEVVGRGTVPVRAGGSIPVVSHFAKGGAPVILTGIGLPDDGLHSPNEKLNLAQLWEGIGVFGTFLKKMAER